MCTTELECLQSIEAELKELNAPIGEGGHLALIEYYVGPDGNLADYLNSIDGSSLTTNDKLDAISGSFSEANTSLTEINGKTDTINTNLESVNTSILGISVPDISGINTFVSDVQESLPGYKELGFYALAFVMFFIFAYFIYKFYQNIYRFWSQYLTI